MMEYVEYPKIDTIFERRPDFTVDTSVLKRPVLRTIDTWNVFEKVDGTNMRICFDAEDNSVQVRGRTNNAQIPGDLFVTLNKMFPADLFREHIPCSNVILFGEGYGPGIQKVGNGYRKDKSFILFDVLVDGKWWLEWADIQDVAKKMGCDVVPFLGQMDLNYIAEYVKEPFISVLPGASVNAEGVIAKPIETLFDKSGKRLIIKLKTCDFQKGHSAKPVQS